MSRGINSQSHSFAQHSRTARTIHNVCLNLIYF